ncbi:zinc ribbon domain-containing protein [Secundilactobacillus yichangensis]|uniref:zinc ribbon domain-containing protein n=1 Tax=Secundilactobacillus yichangensis TaxID=2799580 RepID=UPI0019405524|nr:zinc ribbon domain-containing protein [Secundilactobacillus yichangensis]
MENTKLFCPNCGTENPMSAAFCKNCGADLTAAKAQVQATIEAKTKANQQAIYRQAVEMADKGNARQAAILFEQLGDYQDAHEKAVANRTLADAQDQQRLAAQQQQQYNAAMSAFNQGDLSNAANLFAQLGDYQDAQQKLGLVQNAMAQDQKQAQAQNYEQAYRAVLARANQANRSVDLLNALNELAQFGDYKDARQQSATLQAKLPAMQAAEQAKKVSHGKRNKRIAIIAGIVVVLLVIIGGGYAYHAHTVNALQTQVTAQRNSNTKSFNSLPNTTQQDIRDMVATYHGNVHDYTYSLKQKTANYNIVSYQFVGPDHSKDVLPSSGTRTYNQTAITHQ